MKKTTGTVLVLLTLICALWVTPALATNYTITGYTATAWITDPVNGLLGGDPGVSGYYSIDLAGTSTNNLTGSFTLYAANADGTRNTVNPTVLYSGAMADIFYINLILGANPKFTLGNNVAGLLTPMIQVNLKAPAADPNYPTVVPKNALPVGGKNQYVNQVYIDPVTGLPFSFDNLGNPTDPTAAYGELLATAFTATALDGTTIDLDIEDASVPVPEPSTFLLLGFGLVGIGLIRRRRA